MRNSVEKKIIFRIIIPHPISYGMRSWGFLNSLVWFFCRQSFWTSTFILTHQNWLFSSRSTIAKRAVRSRRLRNGWKSSAYPICSPYIWNALNTPIIWVDTQNSAAKYISLSSWDFSTWSVSFVIHEYQLFLKRKLSFRSLFSKFYTIWMWFFCKVGNSFRLRI